MLPGLSRSSIVRALIEFDSAHRDRSSATFWEDARSSSFAIEYEGLRYPAKTIVSLASGIPVSRLSWDQACELLIQLEFRLVAVAEVLDGQGPNWIRLHRQSRLTDESCYRFAANRHVLISWLGYQLSCSPDERRDPHVHLRRIYKTHTYQLLAAYWDPRPRLLQQIAFYDPSAYEGDGAITHIADVRDFEICPGDRMTPTADEPQIVCRLLSVRTCDRPIRHSTERGARDQLSLPRFTSVLGLSLARNLLEVALTAEPEWRLLEKLETNHVQTQLEPMPEVGSAYNPLFKELTPPPDPDSLPLNGGCWFVANGRRVRFDSTGFILKDAMFEWPFAGLDDAVDFLSGTRRVYGVPALRVGGRAGVATIDETTPEQSGPEQRRHQQLPTPMPTATSSSPTVAPPPTTPPPRTSRRPRLRQRRR